jgi:hypothetical protein
MLQRLTALLLVLFVFVQPAWSAADDISRLYNFSSGTTIQSSQVNGEFNQLITTMNSKFGRAVDNTLSGNNIYSGTSTFSGIATFSSATTPIKTDIISERTAATGVTIDSVLLKDGFIRVPAGAGFTPTTNGDFGYDSTSNTYDVYVNGSAKSLATTSDIGFPNGYINGPAPTYTSASTITLPSGLKARNSTNTADITLSSNKTCVLSSSGAGGLDTGAEASSTWYYVYLIQKSSDGTNACLLSVTNEASAGTITQPSGYDLKRQLPLAIRNDGSSNIIPFVVGQGWPYRPKILYRDFEESSVFRVLNGGTATSFTGVSMVTLVPPISKLATIETEALYVSNNVQMWVRPTGSALSTGINCGVGTVGGAWMFMDIRTDASQSIDYIMQANTSSATIYVQGFVVTEVN